MLILIKIFIVSLATFTINLWLLENIEKIVNILNKYFNISQNSTVLYLLNCPLCRSFWISIIFFIFLCIPVIKYLIYALASIGIFMLFFTMYELMIHKIIGQ